MILNYLKHHLLCASSRYWWRRGILSKFPSSRHLSSSSSYPLDLSGLGYPAGSDATAGLTQGYWNSQTPPPRQGGNTIRGEYVICKG